MRFDEERYIHPVRAAADLLCTHDLVGRILSVNPAASQALGLSMAALRKMTIPELLSPEATSGFADYVRTLLRDGFAVGMMKVVAADGSRRIWEYRNTLDTNERPFPIVRGVARDVTDREMAFQAVRHGDEHFRAIIENASDIIAIIELDGSIRYESPSVGRVLGYPPKVLVGTPFLDLIHPEDAGRAAALLAGQIADPAAIQTIELRVRHHAGMWRSFEIVANNLVKRKQASAIVMNARDITERKLLESQLAQAQRLTGLGHLAATVAHEFNNVLMGMQPFAELMQRPDATPQMITRGSWHIANSIQRGKRIVLDILRFARPYVPVTTAVDLGEWWETFAPEAEVVLGDPISVVSTIPRRGLYAIADRTQLSQVLANLVANARDAMPNGGTLTVGANDLQPDATFPFGVVLHPERFVQISVGDTGHGMDAEVMDRVFEPLFTTRQSGGTGLGLAVAHQVATQHGGFIFVESEPGRGSTFHLFLPRADAASSDASAVCREPGKPAARKVLIIDDEQTIVDGITALLEFDGMEVAAIGDGADAEQAIARFHPDVVVLDYGLPGMDGSAVYTLIRELDRSLPIIFATGHGDRRLLHDGLNDPHTRFLQKPFEVASLLEMIVDLECESAP
jgi:two-component system cell cycle sensor histidine kinase/response regulator CckA